MPELPEVETVRQGITPAMLGAVIEAADIRRPDLRWPFPKDMAARLTGATVLGLRRRAKYILIDLSTEETLLIHLGMSGRMTVSGAVQGSFHRAHPPIEKHDHVVLHMSNGARITFNDARRFGAMDLFATTKADTHPMLAGIGPEPLGNDFHADYLHAAFAKRAAPIKTVLLDQSVIAGLGNIYVCESLYRAGIHPASRANSLSRDMVDVLTRVICDVLQEAITAGGSTLRDHRQADGTLGYFQHGFQVYGHENTTCQNPDCSAKIKRIVQSGRSTFFCPSCQN